MRTLMACLVASSLAGLMPLPAAAWSHANKWGGTTTHEQGSGSTTKTDAWGGSETHTYGEGTTATNKYGDTATHKQGSGQTTVTNPYGGSATHTYGEGTEYHGANGGTAYKSPYYHPDYAYHPPAYAYHPPTYYPYHPPTTVNVYGSSCGSCGGWNTAGAVAVGMVAGAAIATNKAQQQQAASASAYSAGYAAGATNTAYAMGAVYPKTPTGCATPVVGGQSYYLCGNTWFKPSYGANGVFYTVVPPP